MTPKEFFQQVEKSPKCNDLVPIHLTKDLVLNWFLEGKLEERIKELNDKNKGKAYFTFLPHS